MSLKEIETAVRQLPAEDLTQFTRWFQEYLADAWDQEIEADMISGKLDALLEQADASFEAGRVKQL